MRLISGSWTCRLRRETPEEEDDDDSQYQNQGVSTPLISGRSRFPSGALVNTEMTHLSSSYQRVPFAIPTEGLIN